MTKERIKQFIKEFRQIEDDMGEELKDTTAASDLLFELLCDQMSLDEFWKEYEDCRENAPAQSLYVHY